VTAAGPAAAPAAHAAAAAATAPDDSWAGGRLVSLNCVCLLLSEAHGCSELLWRWASCLAALFGVLGFVPLFPCAGICAGVSCRVFSAAGLHAWLDWLVLSRHRAMPVASGSAVSACCC